MIIFAAKISGCMCTITKARFPEMNAFFFDSAFIANNQTDSVRILRDHYLQRIIKYMDETSEPVVAIQRIPANFLLDTERRIVAKDLRGEQLMQTLDSLINQRNPSLQ